MKILAINGTSRPRGTTTRLTESALEGASSQGASTEMILLRDCNIQYCKNCLSCYRDAEAEIAPCTLDDDVTTILEKIRDADGIILSSPVHCGFVSALMVAFMERATWRLCRPAEQVLGLGFGGCPEPRLTQKTRAVATILSAGGIPPKLRRFCDIGTPWLKDQGAVLFNGTPIGDLYAGAIFARRPEGSDWTKLYPLRKLTDDQLKQARGLGVKMVDAIRKQQVRPYRLTLPGGKLTEAALGLYSRVFDPVETVPNKADATPPPLREDLRWVTALAGAALGGFLLGKLLIASRGRST